MYYTFQTPGSYCVYGNYTRVPLVFTTVIMLVLCSKTPCTCEQSFILRPYLISHNVDFILMRIVLFCNHFQPQQPCSEHLMYI